jgi:tellurite resistance protein TerC
MELASFFSTPVLGQPTWLWLSFLALVAALLAFDLGVLHRKQREIPVSESLWLSAGYIAMGLAYGVWIWSHLGAASAADYFTGYLVEKSLSMDNVFVIAMIFSYLAIPRAYQHRVLFWGILGVIAMRGVMIGLGASLISSFSWILYVFGAFLLLTGIKMLVVSSEPMDLGSNPVLRWLRRRVPVTDTLHGDRFFVHQADAGGSLRRVATPLFLALVLIETADLIFAVDSVPAIFVITQDPFIVYTSNIFAVLGLRALYFALAAMIDRFAYLKYALALVLIFIGSKIFLVNIVGKFPAWISLSVTVGLIAGGVLFSWFKTRKASASLVQAT